jgi:hypothetical protein
MRYAFALRYLFFRDLDVLQQIDLLQERLIFADIHEHRRAPSVLRQNDRTTGLSYLPYESSGM